MTVIGYIDKLNKRKNYLPARGNYDDLFRTIMEYHLRTAKGCVVLDYEHLDGVAGQELRIKDERCTDMYILFVRLASEALNPIYILAVLKNWLLNEYCCGCNSEDDLPISRMLVMYLLLEFSISGEPGVLPKVKGIANLSVTMCSAETSSYCLKICEEIEDLE